MKKIKEKLYDVIFESDTLAGKIFDLVLIVVILASVIVVMLDSIETIHDRYGSELHLLEWFFTILFTIEYILRLYCIRRPMRYAISFYGIVDLLAILPTYLSVLFPRAHILAVIRVLRVLRIFRILKYVQYIGEANLLMESLGKMRRKILVYLFFVMTLVVILGSFMYLIEGEHNSGFTSIPTSIYWTIVTMTTVGFGDITPVTPLGQIFASLVMILGYSIIVVPSILVGADLLADVKGLSSLVCSACSAEGHDVDAKYCKQCGGTLNP